MKWLLIATLLAGAGCTTAESLPDSRVDSGAAASAPSISWLVDAAGHPVPVRPASTERDLIAALGASNVTRARLSIGEGEYVPGTVLYAADSLRRLEIFWFDTVQLARPQTVRPGGARTEWRVPPGVTLGSSVADVERANGKPFTLVGFHFDYGGTVLTWNGGRFDSLDVATERVLVRFEPTRESAVSAAELATLSGDGKEILSTDAVLRRVEPTVHVVEIRFRERGPQ